MDLSATIRQGFAGIDAGPALKLKAEENLTKWLTDPYFAAYRPQIDWMVQAAKWSLLLDSFYQVLPFGTGGRRGSVGIGPNRMNLWTVAASVQGHCEYLRIRFPGVANLRVVLAYDVREFRDKRGVYNPSLPNPVLGLSSRNFCEHAAGVYAANGITALILPAGSPRYVPTPELSFDIRYYKAHGGLNMTASHNPPDDNGSKFYNEHGAQPVPPDDQIMSDLVDQVTTIKSMSYDDAVRSGKVQFLDPASHEAYIELCRKQTLVPPPKADELRVVYTPLQGCGGFCAGETLDAQGFRTLRVAEQDAPNGDFNNVTKTPNPEVPESMDRAEALAREQNADVVIATDPDADRLGGLASFSPQGGGTFRPLTGQEIAALLTYFKLSRLSSQGNLPRSPITITTEVTTGQITRISRHFGAQVVNDLLVGFKYHADVLLQLEQTGRYNDVTGTPDDMVIATEESHGILATPHLRDKDSACAALLLAELALHLKRQQRTIPELLGDLARQFGYYRNELLNIVMPGIEGKQLMARMLDTLRGNPPTAIAGLPVTRLEDLLDEDGKMGPIKGATDRASRNFLIFRLGGGADPEAKVCLRPSGTEPKAKAYIEVCSAPAAPGTADDAWAATQKRIDGLVQQLATEFLTLALGTVGLKPTAGADKLSR